jgi:hypothetical protein
LQEGTAMSARICAFALFPTLSELRTTLLGTDHEKHLAYMGQCGRQH